MGYMCFVHVDGLFTKTSNLMPREHHNYNTDAQTGIDERGLIVDVLAIHTDLRARHDLQAMACPGSVCMTSTSTEYAQCGEMQLIQTI